MTRPPCVRMPDWWDTGDDGNRLALMICARCRLRDGTTCRGGEPDPEPYGVVRAGVAYSDAGTALPECRCGYPLTNWARGGGMPALCGRCAAPGTTVIREYVRAIPEGYDESAVERLVAGDPPAACRQRDRREAMRRLWAAGLGHRQVAARLRMSVTAVRRAHQRRRAAVTA